jgi:hypothetical protein
MFYNELTRTWDRTTARDGLFWAAEFARLLGNDMHVKNLIDTFISTTYPRTKKELGEVFFMSELKAASSDFPAICLAQNNATLWKSSNPLGAGNIPGNFADLVDYLRAIPLRFDPLNANNIDFTVTDWSYSGATITLTFAYTTPKGTKESKVVRSLHEDAFVHNSNTSIGVDYSAFEAVTSWRTITLVEPLRDDTDAIQVPVGTYQITAIAGGESGAAQIKLIHSATPSGTPKVESRLTRFYPYRIQDSGQNLDVNAPIKALHFAVQGRGFVTVDNADSSEWVGGLRRRDRFQGHKTETLGFIVGTGGLVSGSYGISDSSNNYYSDGTNGSPRVSNTTDSRGLGLYPYIWAKSYA